MTADIEQSELLVRRLEPGCNYVFRARVEGHGDRGGKPPTPLSKAPEVLSEWSAWSEPMQTPNPPAPRPPMAAAVADNAIAVAWDNGLNSLVAGGGELKGFRLVHRSFDARFAPVQRDDLPPDSSLYIHRGLKPGDQHEYQVEPRFVIGGLTEFSKPSEPTHVPQITAPSDAGWSVHGTPPSTAVARGSVQISWQPFTTVGVETSTEDAVVIEISDGGNGGEHWRARSSSRQLLFRKALTRLRI